MEFSSNYDKMLWAVLMDPDLKKLGNYSEKDIVPLYEALNSDNYVINAVAQIIKRSSDGLTEKEMYKEVTEFLKKNV